MTPPSYSLIKNTFLFIVLTSILSCQKEFNSVGSKLFESQAFVSGKETFPVATYQEKNEAIESNALPLIQLGKIKHPIFGTSEASFASQLLIPTDNPTFGLYSQETEDDADNDDDINTIAEEESVTSVFLEIPFFNNQNDRDNDGVIDALDADPEDPSCDTDGDGITDILETSGGTNPLDQDSDGDGILDEDDEDNTDYDAENSEREYEVDSIYGNRNISFDLKVFNLTFYLNNLDPDNNFESSKLYFSDEDFFENGFFSETLYEDSYQLNLDELRFNYEEDDPETEDVDETEQVETRLSPRIRIPLDTRFFQQNLIDQEGKNGLQSQENFNDFLRGLIIRIENLEDDLYILMNPRGARIEVNYTYRRYDDNDTEDDTEDDTVENQDRTFYLALGGIQINTLKNSLFDPHISSALDESQMAIPSDRIFLNGGYFNSRIRLFDDGMGGENEILESIRDQSWLINEANLVFYLDTLRMESTDALLAERIYIYNNETGTVLEDFLVDSSIDINDDKKNKTVFGGILEYDDDQRAYYKFRITEHISNILRQDSTNVDIGLTVTSNVNDLTIRKAKKEDDTQIEYPQAAILNPIGTVLVGSHPKEGDTFTEQRVQLEIIYTDY